MKTHQANFPAGDGIIQIQLTEVTPAMAKTWLTRNQHNRSVRPAAVERYKAAILRGEHQLTHQGIAFDRENNLLDGQHRLIALSQCPPSTKLKMFVTYGLDRDTVFPVLDDGMKRNHADHLGRPRSEVEAATALARIVFGGNPSSSMVEPFCDVIKDELEDLLTATTTLRKAWSSAITRAAAVYAMKVYGDADYVKQVYRSLVLSDFKTMPATAQALYRQYSADSKMPVSREDWFLRLLVVYDPSRGDLSKVQIKNHGERLLEVRNNLRRWIGAPAVTRVLTRNPKD